MTTPGHAQADLAQKEPRSGWTALTGVTPLLRISLQRDAWRLAAWVAGITLLAASSLLAYDGVFPDTASKDELMASLGSNPAFTLLLGRAHDLSAPGGFTAWRSVGLGSLAAGLMAIFTVVRHTRAEEDAGRTELVASGVVGRHASLAAAVLLAALGCAATTAALFLSLLAAGASGGDPQPLGALTLGVAVGSTGLVFAGVAAVTAQLGAFARTATSLAGAVLAALYVLRGWGAATTGMRWAEWGSPFGWGEQMLPYTGDRLWLAVLPLAVTGVLLGVAHRMLLRRDIGSGLIAARQGPARAPRGLRGPGGLAWRLGRPAALGWAAGFVLLGAVYGSVTSSIDDAFSGNAELEKILSQGQAGVDLTQGYLSMIVTVLALLATMHGVQLVLRGRTEEVEGRAEPVLAGAVSRRAWFASHAVLGLAASAGVLLLGLVALAAVAVVTTPSGSVTVGDLLVAGVVQLPAVWVLVGVAVLLLGVWPRAVMVSWALVAVTFVLALFGPVLGLPGWVLDLSVFEHVAGYLTEGVRVMPLAVLGLIAAGAVCGGFVGVQRRDLGQR